MKEDMDVCECEALMARGIGIRGGMSRPGSCRQFTFKSSKSSKHLAPATVGLK